MAAWRVTLVFRACQKNYWQRAPSDSAAAGPTLAVVCPPAPPAPEPTPRGAHLPLRKPARVTEGGGKAGRGAPAARTLLAPSFPCWRGRPAPCWLTTRPDDVRARHGDGVWP